MEWWNESLTICFRKVHQPSFPPRGLSGRSVPGLQYSIFAIVGANIEGLTPMEKFSLNSNSTLIHAPVGHGYGEGVESQVDVLPAMQE